MHACLAVRSQKRPFFGGSSLNCCLLQLLRGVFQSIHRRNLTTMTSLINQLLHPLVTAAKVYQQDAEVGGFLAATVHASFTARQCDTSFFCSFLQISRSCFLAFEDLIQHWFDQALSSPEAVQCEAARSLGFRPVSRNHNLLWLDVNDVTNAVKGLAFCP